MSRSATWSCARLDTISAGAGDLVLVTDVEADVAEVALSEMIKLTNGIRPSVMEAALRVARKIGEVARRGKRIGALFTIGDSDKVLEGSRQMVLNPFLGHEDEDRMLTNPKIHDMLIELAKLDGAFVVRGDGFIRTAAAYLATSEIDVDVPAGLGSRHIAAAATTARSHATAIVVSATDGFVRAFSGGKLVLQMDPEVPFGPVPEGTLTIVYAFEFSSNAERNSRSASREPTSTRLPSSGSNSSGPGLMLRWPSTSRAMIEQPVRERTPESAIETPGQRVRDLGGENIHAIPERHGAAAAEVVEDRVRPHRGVGEHQVGSGPMKSRGVVGSRAPGDDLQVVAQTPVEDGQEGVHGVVVRGDDDGGGLPHSGFHQHIELGGVSDDLVLDVAHACLEFFDDDPLDPGLGEGP